VLGAEIMKSKKFEVKIYYSGFCTYQIEATRVRKTIIWHQDLKFNKQEELVNIMWPQNLIDGVMLYHFNTPWNRR
jgi:hypothetical protein